MFFAQIYKIKDIWDKMLEGISYTITVLIHVLASVVAVGAVSVIDYLHLVGLRKTRLEKKLFSAYIPISKLVHYAFIVIILSGIILVISKPELLESPIFILKIALVLIVAVNGFILRKKVFPHLSLCVNRGTKYCSSDVLYSSVIAGSVSVVTWYSILILALTKNTGYTYVQFLIGYLVALGVVMLTAYLFEKKARKWRET